MEHIILDTNIFIKENFLEGKRIREFLKLSEEGKIKVVMTVITVGEVKNRFRIFSRIAVQNLNEYKNQFESRVLRNNSAGRKIFDRIVNKDIEKEFNDEFDAILLKSKVIIIDYRDLNIGNVFGKYFKNEFPFGGGDKKAEFPDAFALELIEHWCIQNSIKCRIFSSDKDFLKYQSSYFDITKNYDSYLDQKLQYYLAEEDRISVLNKVFENSSEKIDDEIETWYRYILDDNSLYYSFVWVEIHHVDVTEVKVNNKKYKIVATNEDSIEIEIEADLTFTVDLTIDDENYSYYDSEDKETHYYETTTEEVKRNVTAKVSAIAYITSKEEYEDELEIIDVNKDKELIIKEEYEDYR